MTRSERAARASEWNLETIRNRDRGRTAVHPNAIQHLRSFSIPKSLAVSSAWLVGRLAQKRALVKTSSNPNPNPNLERLRADLLGIMGQAFIGDVFILSQLAVRVGRAFAACPAGTPEDFAEVDNQIKALTIQLDALADALEVDAIAVTSAKDKTRAEIARVLQSCRQTLLDLDCFLAQQHEVGRSAPTSEGADESTERSWKEALVDNWKPARWARDGGSVKTLRNMLQIHTRSVSMTMHAVKR